ncbi:hypothetical protein ACFWDQ_36360 [Streptomyces sp. NPDC060053]|uniref:hypothetical protein n=1 Tax=Streptomyces sp. NPDC060053 TaxID=3347047 RepID=UPI0036B9630D
MTDLGALRQAVADADTARAALPADASPAQRKAVRDAVTAARAALDAAVKDFVGQATDDELLGRLDPAVPLLLTPLRLETRLSPDGGTPDTLRVRIFPDDVHIESHDPELTDGERQQGQRYWTAVWRAGRTDNDRQDGARIRLAAWDQLVGTLGAARARFVARVLAPDVDDRPPQPLPDGTEGPVPKLRDVPPRGRGWIRPATASTLPDRFVALAFQGDVLIGSAPGEVVPDTVQVGPDPDALAGASGPPGPSATPPAPADGMPLDPALRWLVEFDAARQNGLAITVRLSDHPEYDPRRRPLLSRVLVLGVTASMDPQASADRLAAVLSARADHGDAAFVAQGTPTNNTAAVRQTPADAPDVESVLAAAAGHQAAVDPLANSALLATALGVPPATLDALAGAADTEQADARSLQLALWSATGDFFVEHLLAGDSGNEQAPVDRTWLRDHHVDRVRARGPLPVLRLGRQPYGILPVTATARWQPAGAGEPAGLTGLHRTLTTVRPFWEAGVPGLPRVGGPDQQVEPLKDQGVPKPERDVLRALGMAPVSAATDVRAVRGAVNASLHSLLLSALPDGPLPMEELLSRALDHALGLDYRPKIAQHQNEAQATRLWIPHARLLDLPAGTDPVEELASFLEQVVDRFQSFLVVTGPERARTLLEAVLRQSANLEYAHAATALGHEHRLVDRARFDLAELTLAPQAAPGLTAQAGVGLRPFTIPSLFALSVPATDTTAALPIEQALRADRALLGPSVSAAARRNGVLVLTGQERPWSRTLAEMDAGLQYLAKRVRDWGHAGRDPFAMVERLLGECLDLVSHRLDAWITSLATARLAAMRAPEARPTGLQLGAYGWVEDLSPRDTAATARSSGYVLAPSVPQATTAAVLRSGFLSHPDDPGAFAVDLSSRRMRTAMTILDGVRQGQPLGALLGYRLERRLHEARTDDQQPLELDRVIAPLRALAPLQPVPGVAPGDTPEVVTAHDVVDGRRISERTAEEVLADLRAKVTPPLRPADEVPAVAAALTALHDDVDALADLLLAESVHQLTGRNPERAGATLQTLAAGGHPPPRPEVLDIPRQGTPVTHRLLIVLPEDAAPAAGWNTTAQTARARAQAEPRLDAWASRLLAPPDRIRLRASWRSPGRDPATATVVEHRWPLTDHCALDVAALAGAGVLRAALAAALVRPPDVPADALPVPLDDRDPAWNHDVVALPEADALARAVAAVLAGATPGSPAQLRTATAAVPPPVEGDLRDRAVHARDGLRTAKEGGHLDAMAQYGVVPPGLPGQEPATVLAAARREATARLARADEALSPAPGALGPAAALEAVFGTGFRAVDLIAAPDPQELGDSLGAGLVRGDDEQAPRDWLERIGAVRPGVGRLADLLLYADATGTGGGQALRVGQTPFRAGDHWVADPGPAATVSPATGLVLHAPADLDPTARLAVAVVDEWSEVVPGRTRTAGAAFHLDAPGTRPPQSLLLAVPPVPGVPWTLATLAAVLGEALDLAKLRLVDLQALAWLGRYLPAAYLPDTALGTAPGVLFKELMAEAVRRRVFDVMLKKES